MKEEPFETIGAELDRRLKTMDELWDYCIKLGERVAELEKSNEELREKLGGPETVDFRKEDNAAETEYLIRKTQNQPLAKRVEEETVRLPMTMYMSARKTDEGIELTKVDDNLQNYVPFKIEAVGEEAEVYFNPLYECDRENLETKLLTYVDYKINNPSGGLVKPTSTGKALLKNGAWFLIDKPQIVIE